MGGSPAYGEEAGGFYGKVMNLVVELALDTSMLRDSMLLARELPSRQRSLEMVFGGGVGCSRLGFVGES